MFYNIDFLKKPYFIEIFKLQHKFFIVFSKILIFILLILKNY